jgi:hypothetical protein
MTEENYEKPLARQPVPRLTLEPKVFENKVPVLRRIFEPRKKKTTEG